MSELYSRTRKLISFLWKHIVRAFRNPIYFSVCILIVSGFSILFSSQSFVISNKIEGISNNINTFSYQIQGLESTTTILNLDATEFSSKNDEMTILNGLTNALSLKITNPGIFQNYYFSYLQLAVKLGLATSVSQADLNEIQSASDYYKKVNIGILDTGNEREAELDANIQSLKNQQASDTIEQTSLEAQRASISDWIIWTEGLNAAFAILVVIAEERRRHLEK